MESAPIRNPFQPGNPVPPGIFAGRRGELTQIARCISQTEGGHAQNLLITGERGIGKTSIAYVTRSIANGKLDWQGIKGNLLTAYVPVQSGMNPVVVIREGLSELMHAMDSWAPLKSAISSLFGKFEEFSFAGTGFKTSSGTELTEQELYQSTERQFRQLCEAVDRKSKDSPDSPNGVCLIIDETDRLSHGEGFASFWKVLQEKLASNNCRNMMLVLVGMPELCNMLNADHESSLRTFSPVKLDRMAEGEGDEVIRRALPGGIPERTITDEAVSRILFYSERYPHLIQEIGYSAFEVCNTGEITVQDVETGLHGTDDYAGSIKRLGELFFARLYTEVNRSENYKELLRLIAERSGESLDWVSRQSMLQEFSKRKSSLDSYLQQLLAKGVIMRNPEQNGEYRPISKMFRAYIVKILTQQAE